MVRAANDRRTNGRSENFSGGVREKGKTFSKATGENSESVLSATAKGSDGKLFSTGGLSGTGMNTGR